MIELKTLIDITETNIHRNNRPPGSSMTQEEWDFKRNQQRNWSTVVQLLGLRFQPIIIKSPIMSINQNAFNKENITIWQCQFDYEHEFSIEFLNDDFHMIPIIMGLNESVNLSQSCFLTSGENINLVIHKIV